MLLLLLLLSLLRYIASPGMGKANLEYFLIKELFHGCVVLICLIVLLVFFTDFISVQKQTKLKGEKKVNTGNLYFEQDVKTYIFAPTKIGDKGFHFD